MKNFATMLKPLALSIALLSILTVGSSEARADEITIAGYTNGTFNGTPAAMQGPGLQQASIIGLSYTNSTFSGTTVNGPFVRGARDVTILRIQFKRPKGANCLSIRFRFLSEEFPEFKDDDFNDGFIAELNKSTWDATSNEDPTIVAPDNFALGSNGRRVSVKATDELSVTPKRARGTTYDAATRLLRASTPLSGRSVQTVYLSIFDQGDRIYDSAVFLDRMTVDKRSGCKPGTVEDS